MRIKMIGNDIEIDGIKVARVLDISATLRSDFEMLIEQIDERQGVVGVTDEEIKEAYDSGKSDGYAEGREDANSD